MEFSNESSPAEISVDGIEMTEVLTADDSDETAENSSDSIVRAVTLNEHVVGEISKYVDYQTIQSIRKVDRIWSAGARYQFAVKSVVVLKSGKRSKEELQLFGRDGTSLQRFPSIRIKLHEEFGFEAEHDLFNNVIELMSPTLKYFEINGWDGVPFNIRPSITLPSVSTIKLEDCFVSTDAAINMQQRVFSAAPNLTNLTLGDLTYGFNILKPLYSYDNIRIPTMVPNLRSLIMDSGYLEPILESILKFRICWESVDFKEVGLYDEDSFEDLGQLLEINKDNLKTLRLGIHTRIEHEVLRFPSTFSKLTKLELISVYIRWDIDCGDEVVNYSRTFPVLTYLSFKSIREMDVEDYKKGFNIFFSPQVFKVLRIFKLEVRGNYNSFIRRQGIKANWAQVMFPNAMCQFSTTQ